MKPFLPFWGLICCCLLFSCHKEDNIEVSQAPQGFLTIAANRETGYQAAPPDTKLAVGTSDGTYTPLNWTTGDKLGVFGDPSSGTSYNNTEFTLASGEGTSTGNFSTGTSWAEGTYDVYAYYPYVADATDKTSVPFFIPVKQRQSESGNSDHIGKYGFHYAKLNGISITEGNTTLANMQFNSSVAVIEFTAKTNNGNFFVKKGSNFQPVTVAEYPIESILLYGDAHAQIGAPQGIWAMDLSSNPPTKVALPDRDGRDRTGVYETQTEIHLSTPSLDHETKIYMVINPFESDHQCEFDVYMATNNTSALFKVCNGAGQRLKAPSIPGNKYGFEAGKIYRVTIDGSGDPNSNPNAFYLEKEFEDLSENGRTRANCYAVPQNTSGTGKKYAFSIKYEGNSDRHLGKTLYDVLYQADQDRGVSGWSIKDTVVKKVEIDYTNNHGMISDVIRLGSFIVFTLNSGYPGSAVISAKTSGTYKDEDETQTITQPDPLWSWHIWVLPDNTFVTQGDEDPLARQLAGVPMGSQTYLDRNLGATSNGENEGENAYGFYYQWGRKDPLLPYGTDGAVTPASTSTFAGGTIRNPLRFEIRWFTTIPVDIPSSNKPTWTQWNWPLYYAYGDVPGNDKKTYDPCPYGWKLPGNEDWTILQECSPQRHPATPATPTGVKFFSGSNELWLPWAGYLKTDGNSEKRGTQGLYFSTYIYETGGTTETPLGPGSRPTHDVKVYRWNDSNFDTPTVSNSTPTLGASVRCVKYNDEYEHREGIYSL